MKSFVTSAFALASTAQAQNVLDLVQTIVNPTETSDAQEPVSTSVSKNKFGCLVEETVFSHPHVEKTITAPLVPFHMDYEQQESFLRD